MGGEVITGAQFAQLIAVFCAAIGISAWIDRRVKERLEEHIREYHKHDDENQKFRDDFYRRYGAVLDRLKRDHE